MRIPVPKGDVLTPEEIELYCRAFRAGYLDLRHPARLQLSQLTDREVWPEAYDAGSALAYREMYRRTNPDPDRPRRTRS